MLRRLAITGAAAFATPFGLAGCATPVSRRLGRIVVIGGGFAGAAFASEIKSLAGDRVDVRLIEQRRHYVAWPLTARAIGRSDGDPLRARTVDWIGLRARGTVVIEDRVTAIDPARRSLRLSRGQRLEWDRLVLATGAQPRPDAIRGWDGEAARERIPLAWFPEQVWRGLTRRLQALPEHGTVVLGLPRAPVSGPWAGYERATVLAGWLARERPGARLIVLDGNRSPAGIGPDFPGLWQRQFGGRVDYRPGDQVVAVEPRAGLLLTEFNERIPGDLIDLMPPVDAGELARQTGLLDRRDTWCGRSGPLFESDRIAGIHLLGDLAAGPRPTAAQRVLAGPDALMPRTAALAEAQGRWLARGLQRHLDGLPIGDAGFEAASLTGVDAGSAWQTRQRFRYAPAEGDWHSETLDDSALADPSLVRQVTDSLARIWG